jgi:predicted RNA-binding protein Jag
MDKRNKVVFTVKIDDKDTELAVLRPTSKQQKQAQIHYNALFAELITQPKPAILREALDDVARKQGLWSDEKQAEYIKLLDEFNELELKLDKGGIKLSEAKHMALRMKTLRQKMRQMRSWSTRLDALTAQGQADNHSFNYLVSECTVYNETGNKYFKNLDDLTNRDEEEATVQAAKYLAEILYDFDSNAERKFPENKFLLDYKLVDDQLRLVNQDGKLIDEQGRLIDENGNLVDSNGNLIDERGNKVNTDGDFIVDRKPFLDDEGKEITG